MVGQGFQTSNLDVSQDVFSCISRFILLYDKTIYLKRVQISLSALAQYKKKFRILCLVLNLRKTPEEGG